MQTFDGGWFILETLDLLINWLINYKKWELIFDVSNYMVVLVLLKDQKEFLQFLFIGGQSIINKNYDVCLL